MSVTYHGGKVLTSGVEVFLIWYGNWSEADKATVRNFVGGLSPWLSPATAFYDSAGAHVLSTVTLVGEYQDDYSQGVGFLASAVVQIVQNAISMAPFPVRTDAIYVVLGSPDTSNSYGTGYHWGLPINGVQTQLIWSHAFGATPAFSIGQGVISVVSHELIEAITDPQGSGGSPGWYEDATGEECADLCGTYGSIAINGVSYQVANYLTPTGGCAGSSGGGGTGGGGTGGGGGHHHKHLQPFLRGSDK